VAGSMGRASTKLRRRLIRALKHQGIGGVHRLCMGISKGQRNEDRQCPLGVEGGGCCHEPVGMRVASRLSAPYRWLGLLLIERIRASGIDRAMFTALALWRTPLAVCDSGKILLDLAIMPVLSGDCLADVNLLRCKSDAFGESPTIRRRRGLIDTLATDAAVRGLRRCR
jgi:hypothetical protein